METLVYTIGFIVLCGIAAIFLNRQRGIDGIDTSIHDFKQMLIKIYDKDPEIRKAVRTYQERLAASKKQLAKVKQDRERSGHVYKGSDI